MGLVSLQCRWRSVWRAMVEQQELTGQMMMKALGVLRESEACSVFRVSRSGFVFFFFSSLGWGKASTVHAQCCEVVSGDIIIRYYNCLILRIKTINKQTNKKNKEQTDCTKTSPKQKKCTVFAEKEKYL